MGDGNEFKEIACWQLINTWLDTNEWLSLSKYRNSILSNVEVGMECLLLQLCKQNKNLTLDLRYWVDETSQSSETVKIVYDFDDKTTGKIKTHFRKRYCMQNMHTQALNKCSYSYRWLWNDVCSSNIFGTILQLVAKLWMVNLIWNFIIGFPES